MPGTNPRATKEDAAKAAFLSEMFGKICFVRAFEEEALRLTQANPPRVAGSMHLCAGQEVVPVAAMEALGDEDQVVCTYRGHGWALAAGLDPEAVMAEICQRSTGLNGGRAGSAYMMAPHTRFIGENSIVGAGTTIACGVAMANRLRGRDNVVMVTIGDGAMNQGSVHEAMAFAAVRKLPVIFVVENNGWSELTPTSDMFHAERLAVRGKAYGIPSATISGTDPVVVRDSFAMAAAHARAGNGPSLIECTVPRLWGHYNRDIEHYRSKADRAEATARDPLVLLAARLQQDGVMTDDEVAAIRKSQEDAARALVLRVMASPAPSPADALQPIHGQTTEDRKARAPESRSMSYVEAVNAALRAELEEDERTVLYGEDVGKSGGIFAASRYLQRDFGADRVFDTPIAENAILGSAVGAALGGLKPIVEIMWADFIFVALDQLVNQAANVRYITAGKSSVPLVVRTQQGATPGSCAQHSQSIEAILAHVPGLKVALAATPHDAYTLLRAAAADPDPCVVIEARALYADKGEVEIAATAEPAGRARLRRSGADLAIITWGTMVGPALAAAERLAAAGCDTAVLDLRWLAPLDEAALLEVVRKAGGRVLVVHEAVRTGGFGAEIVARLHEALTGEMALRIRRVTTPDTRIPAAPSLQAALIPDADSIIAAALALTGKPYDVTQETVA
uniref:2-oxoglutarate dehydrogenase E1 component n=1 Tax=Caulobacter sp. (strain K31) TaxID=366602 RepID=B0T7I2_CAUSK